MKEIIKENVVLNKEPGCLYYIDSEGNVCKTDKKGTKHSFKRKIKTFDDVNLTLPKILLHAHISKKIRTVRKMGQGGMIHFPLRFVGKRFKVLLIPENEVCEESFDTVNVI